MLINQLTLHSTTIEMKK